jgi:hypothetical protein
VLRSAACSSNRQVGHTGARAAGRRYPLFYLEEGNVKERNVGMIWMHLHKFCFMIAWGA